MPYYEAVVLIYVPDTESYSMGTSCDEVHFVNGAIHWDDNPPQCDIFSKLDKNRMYCQLKNYEEVTKAYAGAHWNDLFYESGGI